VGKAISPQGKTVSRVGKAISRQGKTVSRVGKMISPQGKIVSRQGIHISLCKKGGGKAEMRILSFADSTVMQPHRA
jgi:hypothetical protein